MDCKSTFCPFKLKENNNIGRKHSILIRFVDKSPSTYA